MTYRSETTDAQPPDSEILAALSEDLLLAGRVNGEVALYRKPPADIWSANPTDFGLTKIGSLIPVPEGYELKTIGYTVTLHAPLSQYLRVLVAS